MAISNKAIKISQKHLLGIQDLSIKDINYILNEAKNFITLNKSKSKKIDILRGKTQINLFFEPSTRTQSSFDLAGKRLGADVINMNIEGSSLRKGESLFDTAQTLGAMNPDLVIIRHGENDASKEIAKILECPVINAGEGVNEHPTQALLDAYTIINHNRKLNDITVSICGDLEHSRVARSNYYLLNKMKSKVRFVFPDYFKPKDLDKYDVETFTNLEEGIKGADIVMMLRIQNERIKDLNLPSADDYFRSFGLTYEKLKSAKPEVLVLHPGPINRGVEIENELADDVNKSVITEQVENGVAVRMACLSIMVK